MRSVHTLFVPVRRPRESGYAWSIAEPHLIPGKQQVMRLPFPGQDCESGPDGQWDRNCQSIVSALANGQDGAFLTEGDPLLYGSFIQIASRIRVAAPDIPIEVIPGISSITAAAAAADLPLVEKAERLAVLPASYSMGELRQVLRDFDTVVLLKVNHVLREVQAVLDELGLAERAVLVERCGHPEQHIVRGLSRPLGSVGYFSLVIVKK
jgi:precorrin-2/cobalt-factor-2 C20-methyltransferase